MIPARPWMILAALLGSAALVQPAQAAVARAPAAVVKATKATDFVAAESVAAKAAPAVEDASDDAAPAIMTPAHEGVAFSPKAGAPARIVESESEHELVAASAVSANHAREALAGLIHAQASGRPSQAIATACRQACRVQPAPMVPRT